MTRHEDLESLVARVPDGALLALPPEYSWVPMAAVRALIRRRVKDLHVLAVPIGGLALFHGPAPTATATSGSVAGAN